MRTEAVKIETPTDYPEVMVGGLRTARLSRRDMMTMMVAECAAARMNVHALPRLIFTANGHSIALAATDANFRKLLDRADMIHADGQPVVLASRWFTHTPVPERTATTDFFHDGAVAASAHGLSFYLLGATEEVNAACAELMRKRYPGLHIAGRRNGYFSRDEEAAICEEINASGADIVWVGLGVPLEQEFCVRNKHRLRAGWLVTAGGCFNFVTGHYSRAPEWMQNAGLEWLYRVWCEPKRLWLRYAITNPVALAMMLIRTADLSTPGTR
ncbi:MAG TPA: WecB/TagA/CpsF family glycosyltransferase [Rhizomicrobium sp.]|jgi:N-acetylglucosaminyldiphosphoundecaprenol N-acetyl-beta-D-mannosaminyltransferase|nr:WecB/TagA/CpsF family glycosyltransferase [Rhizomicrobium sp.]